MSTRTPTCRARTARFATVLSVLTAALIVACGSPTAPPQHGVPETFEFRIGGFGVGSRGLKLHGDTIVTVRVPWDYRPDMPLETRRVVPTAEAWQEFWAAARVAGVHHWRRRYVAPDIVDGTGWDLALESGGFRVASQGSNAYPDSRGRSHEGDFTDGFRHFLAALRELTGEEF
jgi:hypothetical protein